MSADDATTSTPSYMESEAKSPNYSTMDAALINTSFELCSVSPLKGHGKSKQTQAAEARHKILKSANVLLGYVEQEKASVQICEMQDDGLEKDNKEKVELSYQLCEAISEKIQSADRITKLQLLSLILDTWSVERAAQHFGVTKYQVKKARKMKMEQGILPRPEKSKGRALSEETKELVINFYHNEEFSKILTGKKDSVSLGRNVQGDTKKRSSPKLE